MEIEGIAPLIILHNWGSTLKHSLWIHFIDNAAALGALVKGSSSVVQHDITVGAPWELIAKLDILARFDGVTSGSNPVDAFN